MALVVSVNTITVRIRNYPPADCQPFRFKKLEVKEVEQLLRELNPQKATGWDHTLPIALKLGVEEPSLQLTTLYNACIQQGY